MIREETVTPLGQTTITWRNNDGQLHNNYDTDEWAITTYNPDGKVAEYFSYEDGLLHNLHGPARGIFDYVADKTHNLYATYNTITNYPQYAMEALDPDTTARRLTWLIQNGDSVVAMIAAEHPNATGSTKMFASASIVSANAQAELNN